MRRVPHWSRLAGILALLAACRAPGAPPAYSGRYLLLRDGGVDTLDLLANGRYSHVTTFGGKRFIADSGTWSTTTIEGNPRLEIKEWVLWQPPDTSTRLMAASAGTWLATIDSLSDGTIVLPVDREKDWRFRQLP